MNGKIIFDDVIMLSNFLKEFSGSTATFEVYQEGSAFILKFTGGY